ncbi:hypothetical protein BDY24DRAFT_414337 [Mrakia frigida]|uniref:F-box protein n=1 Tax=Mrakia frigida TaxID=29902 RepID=UPI003FCC011E
MPDPTPSSNLYIIPPELLRDIFSYCTPPTLANVCSSNKTFLELASPFLYTHIVLDKFEAVLKLLGLETSPSSSPPSSSHDSLPRLLPLSQIESFTYVLTQTGTELSALELLVLPTPRSTRPLPINLLVLRISQSHTLELDASTILHLFNPSTFVLRGASNFPPFLRLDAEIGPYGAGEIPPFLSSHHLGSSWTRLSSLVLSNAWIDPLYALHGIHSFDGEGEPAAVAAAAAKSVSSFTLYYDLLDLERRPLSRSISGYKVVCTCYSTSVGLERESEVHVSEFVQVVAWVASEEDKDQLEKDAKNYSQALEGLGGDQSRGGRNLRVEVWPSRAGRRDRDDAWAGKSIVSWR